MEVLEVAQMINKKISLLEKMRVEIRHRAVNKAEASANYDKVIALTILKLKNGAIEEFGGEPGKGLPATVLEKIARGICWAEKLKADEAEALYKSLISNIDSVMAELCGLQSLNRYLDKV